jgi:hypothetical protein
MKPKYRRTFLSTQTGREWVQSSFLEGKSDEAKVEIFQRNRNMWESIRPQVRVFLEENLTQWENEKPEWFTDLLISSFDDDLLPSEDLRRLRGSGRDHSSRGRSVSAARGGAKSRRRGSAGGFVDKTVRQSLSRRVSKLAVSGVLLKRRGESRRWSGVSGAPIVPEVVEEDSEEDSEEESEEEEEKVEEDLM